MRLTLLETMSSDIVVVVAALLVFFGVMSSMDELAVIIPFVQMCGVITVVVTNVCLRRS